MVMNTFTDFYLMTIPIPVIWKSHLPKAKKITLVIMFSGGLLEMAFGILRCVSILTVGDSDPSQSGYWSVRESFVSFVLTNMPMLYPLLKSLFQKLGTTKALTNDNGGSGRAPGSGQAYRLSSFPGQHKKTRNKSSNHMPTDALYGSDEHIFSLTNETHGAASSAEGASVDDQSHVPFRVAGNGEGARVTVCSGPSPSDVRRPTPTDHSNTGGITVTREYNVFENRRTKSVDHNDRAFLDV
ncbi:hypothetical protein Daus18300_013461 [Diaporthe australafricana]|uniref:Rhodopsin domain-containing protein n=1 Tax=Diaporthe australafricana TaxID=127596 RepID=A0ABR3VZ04_9PEZI